jgi:hypothetical protein|tara:strand:- start:351 stop:497 length:147 start_codon:yes stop_codon:yes gene_type:complete
VKYLDHLKKLQKVKSEEVALERKWHQDKIKEMEIKQEIKRIKGDVDES